MSDSNASRARAWRWGVLLVGVAVAFGYNIQASLRLRGLETAVAAQKAEAEKLRLQIKEDEKTLLTGWHYFLERKHDDAKLKKMLGDSSSREDFLVREGQRIAWSRLGATSSPQARLAVYVPAGIHRLHFGLLNREGQLTVGQLKRSYPLFQDKQLLACLPGRKKLPPSVPLGSFELGPAAEVYEVVLESKESDVISISVYGEEHKLIDEASISWITGKRSVVAAEASRGIAFPNEVAVEGRETFAKFIGEVKEFPPVDMASIEVGGTDIYKLKLEIGIWMESEGPHCMPAIDVASRIAIAGRHGVNSKMPSITTNEIRRCFLPYSGGDRMYFRN